MKCASRLDGIARALGRGAAFGALVAGLAACSNEPLGSAPATGPSPSGGPGASGGAGGAGATGGTAGAGGGDGGGGGGGNGFVDLEDLLERLRDDRDGTLLEESKKSGWPVPTDEGWVVVSTAPDRTAVAGDFDEWAGTALTPDAGFAWAALPLESGDRYKLTDGVDFRADPWARSYAYDEFGELSMLSPSSPHLDRHFVTGAALADRTVRVWIASDAPTRVLYVHDGQNLFDPEATGGGWKLQTTAPADVLVVGIDNTAARMDEYTHVPDDIGVGSIVGGEGDAYADYLQDEVRPLVAAHYGEPPIVGVMGSSLGGLVSLHIAARYPGEFDFAASLSGTLGWGKIGQLGNETMIERYAAAGHGATAIYVDSGGGGACVDSDGDGVDDDAPDAADNYCETLQMRDTLVGAGYAFDVDLWHWHEPGAPHNEAAWAARVSRPLDIFSAL